MIAPTRLVLSDGHVTEATLLSEIVGFARVGETTGGLGRRLLIVSTSEDRAPKAGPPIQGSFRAAIEQARRDNGGWILFDARLRNTNIDLTTQITVPPNTTIDGGCADVTLTGAPDSTILFVNTTNVVIDGLRFRKRGLSRSENTGDCITVGNTFDRVYIAHSDFGSCTDGQIDVTTLRHAGGGRISVAWNRFSDHDKSMIVGSLDCSQHPDQMPCDNWQPQSGAWQTEIHATLIGNLFFGTGQRHPRVSGRAFVHMVNNVVVFRNYGLFVDAGGRALIEDSLFFRMPGEPASNNLAAWTTATRSEHRPTAVPPGAVAVHRSLAIDNVMFAEALETLVGIPSYSLSNAIRIDGLGSEQFSTCVAARAGRNGLRHWPSHCAR